MIGGKVGGFNWDPASTAAENADVVANCDQLQKLKFAKVLTYARRDELFGLERKMISRGKRGPAPQWQRQMGAVAQFPRARQRFVSGLPQSALAQAARR